VTFSRAPDGACRLAVRDNGVGLPGAIDVADTSSLGLQLVRDLVEQLDGVLSVNRSVGASFVLTFPNHPPAVAQ